MWGKQGSFPHKTLWIAIVFFHKVFFYFFCYDFSKIIFIDFIFFNIEHHVGEAL